MDYRDYNYGESFSGDCDHTEAEFRRELYVGENILWCREYKKTNHVSWQDEKVWAIIILVFIFIGFLVTAGFNPGIIVLLLLLVWALYPYLKKKPEFSSYAITDRRIILNNNGTFTSDELSDIKCIAYRELKDGTGSIGYSKKYSKIRVYPTGRAYSVMSRGKPSPLGVTTVYGVENPEKVHGILENAISKSKEDYGYEQ